MSAAAWIDAVLAAHWARFPVNATFSGVHDHDHLLPDLTEAGDRRWAAQLGELLAAAPDAAGPGLPRHVRDDLRLARNHLRLQQLELELPQFHTGNPAHWTGEAVFSVIALFQRDAAPLPDRVRAATARMQAIPGFLALARERVPAAHPWWTDRAAREADAGVAYFARGIPILAAERGIADAAFLEAATASAAAFHEHAAWLRGTPANEPSAEVAAGRAALDAYLSLGHCLPEGRDAAWLAARAERALADAVQRLEDEAARLEPGVPWREQLARLADLHPTADGYYAAYRQVWDEARAAAVAADLVTWPDYPIEYVPIPASDREAAEELYYLFYRCPPPHGRPATHRYLVTPVEPEMPAEEQGRRLRGANDSQIKLNHVVHHGGLGHHVQNWNAFRGSSRIGQVAGVDCASRINLFCAGTLVEGWACYATELMDEIGFLTPLERLSELHTGVRMAARAVADVALHTGAMTIEETAAFYEREAAMPPASARGEAVKNAMFPGAACIYLLGTDRIRELRREVAAREGAAFSLRDFHDRFLAHGAIPVQLIAEAMLADPAS